MAVKENTRLRAKAKILPGYSKAVLSRLKAEAAKQIGTPSCPVRSVSHLHPRAYCVAKPATMLAVFVVPSCDREPQVRTEGSVIVQNYSARDIQAGDWCALAYVVMDGNQQNYVIEKYQAARLKTRRAFLKKNTPCRYTRI